MSSVEENSPSNENRAAAPRKMNTETDDAWMAPLGEAVEQLLRGRDPARVTSFLDRLTRKLREAGSSVPLLTNTPYVNTIPASTQPPYPGDPEVEERIETYLRWNAMAMVVNANRRHNGIGGHLSSYASCATLYEVGFNHFFRGADAGRPADIVYFQGHASPGNYARAFLEGRLDETHLSRFRQEIEEGEGLPSYPHPYLMNDFWEFPTVSMGLGPIMSAYQARFDRYLRVRGLLAETREPKIWCFVGDGEMDEPESMAPLTFAGREQLDNLIWVVNCNLQRLDGPVRGNGKIIQELEGLFRGAGWNVVKLIWGGDWDPLLEADEDGLLVKRMDEVVDGDYQKYSVEPGSYTRKRFFGKYPALLERVQHLSDDEIRGLRRGGHDREKIFAAYRMAFEHKGAPTVILAKTVKGYGLGEAGEASNVAHQQKKLSEKQLREFCRRFDLPIPNSEVADVPFFKPPPDSEEIGYLHKRRRKLGGFIPRRRGDAPPLVVPGPELYEELFRGSGSREVSTTMTFVRLLSKMLKDNNIGQNIVPIIPDEARTFGMDALFRQVGIYASKGQLYEPVDKAHLLYYREEKTGQVLEEGISEAGSLSSFIAAGTAYATYGVNMIPFFTFYSMFGFQRIGDLIWAAGDVKAKGFLLGATAGRTSLFGEGLQHQDGHSQLIAGAFPTLLAYHPAFGYEVATIIQDGMRRMYAEGEEVACYMTLYNDSYAMPEMPEGSEEGILKGLYRFRQGGDGAHKAHIFGSGPIMVEALKAQEILAEKYRVSADVWSATSYKQLRTDALRVERRNRLQPSAPPERAYVETLLEEEDGVFVAASDYMKMVPDQIAPWVPGGLVALGTDGFGRSDTKENLRRFFEVDAGAIVVATLYALAKKGLIEKRVAEDACKEWNLYPEKPHPESK